MSEGDSEIEEELVSEGESEIKGELASEGEGEIRRVNVWPSAREERRWCQRRAAGEVVVVSKEGRRWQRRAAEQTTE